jgi:hypothetical protein
MLRGKILLIIAALALLALMAGCASQAGSQPSTVEATTAATPPVSETAAPAESPLASPTVEATQAVTSTETVSATGTVTATEVVSATGTVKATDVVTGTSTPEAQPTVEMPPQSEAVQTWTVLWDPEMGFEVRYPPGWVVAEGDVTEADAPITRTYTLQPSDWPEDWAPITVEVSQGTMAEFRQKYKEPTNGEERHIGSLTYTYESTGVQNSQERLAIFTSPYDPNLRVVIRDVVTASQERAQKYADFPALIQKVVESFRWRK